MTQTLKSRTLSTALRKHVATTLSFYKDKRITDQYFVTICVKKNFVRTSNLARSP